MTLSLKHTFNSAKTDGADATLIQPSAWNSEHTITAVNNTVIGNVSGGTGAVSEVTATQLSTLLNTVATNVRYDTVQSLIATQQTQARANILAASVDALAYGNLAINPFHTISQQYGSSVVSNISSASYVTDQNIVSCSGGINVSAQQIANPFTSYPSIPFGQKLLITTAKSSLAATDFVYTCQYIEGLRVAKLGWGTTQAQPIVVGQLMRSNVALLGAVNIVNVSGGRAYTVNFSLAANTDTWITAIIPGDVIGTWPTDTSIGLIVRFCFGTGSTYQTTPGSWQTGAYLGTSSTTNLAATLNNYVIGSGLVVLPALSTSIADAPTINDLVRFQRHPDDELRMCQRYFATQTAIVRSYAAAVSAYEETPIYHPVIMRISPTVALISAGTRANLISVQFLTSTTQASRSFAAASAIGDFYSIGDIVSFNSRM